MEGENSLAESVVGLYLAGLNGWSGLDGEDEGKLHLSMEGRTIGRETCQEATPRPGSGRRASREPELVFGAQCGDEGWARARGLETITSAYSCLPGTVGDGSNTKGSALPGSWRTALASGTLPKITQRTEILGLPACAQCLREAAEDLTAHKHFFFF